ncbi:MAG: hypothetical protein ACYC1Z_06800 [Georgenia sp.]
MSRQVVLLTEAVALVGLNLRGPIVGVPPLIPRLSADLGLSESAAGLLTSLPLPSFALVSPLVGPLVRGTGLDGALVWVLVLLAAASALRPWGSAALLLRAPRWSVSPSRSGTSWCRSRCAATRTRRRRR